MVAKKIGLIGCGNWGKNILRDLVALNCEVHLVLKKKADAESTSECVKSCRNEITDDLVEMDGFVVATPIATHYQVLKQLAHFNKPVYCEKSLTNNMAEALELQDIYGDRLFVMHKWRYHPGIIKISEMIHNGELGELLLIRITRNGWSSGHDDVKIPLQLLPHDLSVLVSFLGELPPVDKVFKTLSSPAAGGLFITMKDETSPAVCLEYSIASPEVKKSFTVVGNRATVQLSNSFDDELLLRRGPPGEPSAVLDHVKVEGPMPLFRQLQQFLGYLDGGEAPLSSLSEALLEMQCLEDIQRAGNI